MDPNPNHFPILSYVMAHLPSLSSPKGSGSGSEFGIEQPPPASIGTQFVDPLVEQMPHLKDPKVIATMGEAVAEIAQTRSVLRALGPRPDHEVIDAAKAKVADIDANLSNLLEEVSLSAESGAGPEGEIRVSAEKEKQLYKSIIQVDEMHTVYEKLLKEAEVKLMRIYDTAVMHSTNEGVRADKATVEVVSGEVLGILKDDAVGKRVERVNLAGRKLKLIPETFGKIKGLVVLNLSNNLLEAIPDSIGGLETLEELDLSSNMLESLPDSIGLLLNLRILLVPRNKLSALPDPISLCKSLEEVDASFNSLIYLPTNMGYELVNLKRLCIHYNKIRSLPTSIGDMKLLLHLDLHFNELRSLPLSIGKLSSLESLNLSGNFSDLQELPDTFGDLVSLKELDLSNNQIHKLPITFGRLENLTKLNLDQNPIEIPPLEVVNKGVEAVKLFMANRWTDLLVEKELKSQQERKEETTESQWLQRSLSRVSNVVSSVSEYLGSPRTPRSPREAYLDQQL